MIIRTHAYARAGLIGNPSDGYHGKTISIIIRNYAAAVTLYESPRLNIIAGRRDHREFDGIDDLRDDIRLHGYYGGLRLVKAAIKRFSDWCAENGVALPPRNFTTEYDTNIPVRVGLAGSSAIVTATLRALMRFYDVDIPQPILPNVILSAELDELKVGAGLQDRVIQTYEGAVFMDFDAAYMAANAHGRYEALDPTRLPPLFVAFHDNLAEGTEVTHNDLRSRYNRGEQKILDAMKQFADYAQQARDLIVAGKGRDIAPLMDANFDLRASLVNISEGNRKLVDIGRRLGAAVKFAGSGGAVVGCYDGDPDRLKRLSEAYRQFGAVLLTPTMQA